MVTESCYGYDKVEFERLRSHLSPDGSPFALLIQSLTIIIQVDSYDDIWWYNHSIKRGTRKHMTHCDCIRSGYERHNRTRNYSSKSADLSGKQNEHR